MPTKEYQEHEGAKDASTLYVQYNYDTTATGGEYTKGLRPTLGPLSQRPPGALHLRQQRQHGRCPEPAGRDQGRQRRLAGRRRSREYTYLGRGRIVVEDYQQPDVRLNYDSGTAGEYAGLDRFGRVVDQLWYDYGASADRDRFTYGYDRASNRLYRENTMASGKDEFYTYDEVNRLATFDRGDLNVGKTAICGTPVREEDWGLDMTGNWSDFLQKTSGSTDLDQDRTHNEVNEITGITETRRHGLGRSGARPGGQHDHAAQAVESRHGAHLQVGRLEPAGGGQGRRHGRGPLRIRWPGPAGEAARRFRRARPIPTGSMPTCTIFYNHAWQVLETREQRQREHRARIAAAAVSVRLVAALHRRPRAAGREHGRRRPVRRRPRSTTWATPTST